MLIAPQIPPPNDALRANLTALRQRLAAAARAAGRTEASVTVVAVSKGQEAAVLRAAAALGIADFGESYLQEALPKLVALQDLPLTWHFIGRIQANKTRPIAQAFDWVHGLDRLQLAERLSQQRSPHRAPLNVCIQVNIADEPAKAGVSIAAAAELVGAVRTLPRLCLRGLMCILPAADSASEDVSRRRFAALHALLTRLNADGAGLDTLSMGMSADFDAAVREGATLVRIGTAIFGPRPNP
jgi:pyridoxal phosphate enzyme (YggS family)